MSCMGRAAGDDLSAPTIISKKPFMVLSQHPPNFFLSWHQPGSELIGRAPATQNIKQPAGWGAPLPSLTVYVLLLYPSSHNKRVCPKRGLIRSSGRHEMGPVSLSALTEQSLGSVGAKRTDYSRWTDWGSVFSRLPIRDCTSWICLETHTPNMINAR